MEVPRKRHRRNENEAIKKGALPEGREENCKRLMHSDLDARWTKKRGIAYCGYKNDVNVDAGWNMCSDSCP